MSGLKLALFFTSLDVLENVLLFQAIEDIILLAFTKCTQPTIRAVSEGMVPLEQAAVKTAPRSLTVQERNTVNFSAVGSVLEETYKPLVAQQITVPDDPSFHFTLESRDSLYPESTTALASMHCSNELAGFLPLSRLHLAVSFRVDTDWTESAVQLYISS